MMKLTKTVLMTMGAVASSALLLSSAGTATAATPDPSIRQLAAHGEAGQLTAVDRAYLGKHPEVAALIPDSSKGTTGSRPMDASDHARMTAALGMSVAASTCSGTDRYQIHKSYLGSIIFEYHSYVRWCWSGGTTTVQTHYPYLANTSDIVENQKTLIKTVRTLSASTKQTDHQNFVKLCVVKYGCYANLYPRNKVTVKNAPGSTFWHDI